jgi:hypothetical protein
MFGILEALGVFEVDLRVCLRVSLEVAASIGVWFTLLRQPSVQVYVWFWGLLCFSKYVITLCICEHGKAMNLKFTNRCAKLESLPESVLESSILCVLSRLPCSCVQIWCCALAGLVHVFLGILGLDRL